MFNGQYSTTASSYVAEGIRDASLCIFIYIAEGLKWSNNNIKNNFIVDKISF